MDQIKFGKENKEQTLMAEKNRKSKKIVLRRKQSTFYIRDENIISLRDICVIS